MIQLATTLNPIWIQRAFCRNDRCRVSYRTLHRMGYIITSKPTATHYEHVVKHHNMQTEDPPIGIETPTNFPRCNDLSISGTKFPSIIPIPMARKIQRARNRSRIASCWKAEVGWWFWGASLSLLLSSVGVGGQDSRSSGECCWSWFFCCVIFAGCSLVSYG